ncbi:hypothetical protein QBC34DRAFT_16377 [Podospora aff. communis PSN243]|uniref:Histone-lysine N-methyltransferase n=1 Tax=Podospora aff. communis PSN243 TaxID=3040156 RepID=A0AAV9H1P7_9PEZI|nr:hypothetical protein QBC34DRAFT_16377 [Podospora aff. communis PSN243]
MATEVTMAGLAALTSETGFSAATADATDASSNPASFSSTPPTTISSDSMSLASEPGTLKQEITITAASHLDAAITVLENVESQQQASRQQTPVGLAIVVAEDPLDSAPPSETRARRARASLPVYNLSKLSGTDAHGKRRAKGDSVGEKRRRTISGDTLVNDDQEGASGSADVSTGANCIAKDGKNKLKENPATALVARRATRLSGAPPETLTTKLSALGKRGKKTFEKSLSRMSRELRRLQDTNEFAHIETRPVRYTVWSNGKYVEVDTENPEPVASPPRKKAKLDGTSVAKSSADDGESAPKPEAEAPSTKKRRTKKYLEKGLYAGQEAPTDVTKGLTAKEKKKLASIPELMTPGESNKTMPFPIYNGLRLLLNGRDFKLPYDVCNPLPPGQPKPAAYRTMTKNRFVGDAAAYWKKTPHFGDSSKCVCKPEDGCAEDCQNRIMLYECDDTNCNVGKAHCQNRAFQTLQERTKRGGRYRVGVEVYKTADRGYGVRSNRCFEPNQIIMEYTGEIITEEECERRMNEVYKDNECYYLMSFDQNMIIDATTGSIARFVNHSCSPNCRMIKWIVSGQPRMALFAGDRPIMTGDELTYDYNFDPFSAKNVQKCLCGSPNCRGVLGPKPKEVKPPKPPKEDANGKGKKASVKGSVKAGKRKLKELLGGDRDDSEGAPKKRKIKPAMGAVKAKSTKTKAATKLTAGRARSTALKAATKGAAKGAATAIKRRVSSASVKAKTALSKKTAAGYVASRGLKQTKIAFKKAGTVPSSRSSSLTIVAASAGPLKLTAKSNASGTPKAKAPVTPASSAKSARTRTPSRKVLEGSSTPKPAASPVATNKGKKSPAAVAAKAKSARVQVVQQSVYDFPN